MARADDLWDSLVPKLRPDGRRDAYQRPHDVRVLTMVSVTAPATRHPITYGWRGHLETIEWVLDGAGAA